MEDTRTNARKSMRLHGVSSGTTRAWTCALAAFFAAVAPPIAGAGTPTWEEFTAKVKDLSHEYQRVTVALNRSVMVETSIEVARVNVVAAHIADVQPISPTELMVSGLSYGTTQVVLWSPDDRRWVLEVSVELNLDQLREALQGFDPQAELSVESVLGHIVMRGTVTSAQTARRMTELAGLYLGPASVDGTVTTVQNHLQVSGEQQVLLRCTVAEISRSASRQLGINGFLAGDDVRDMFVVNQIGGINPANIGAAADANVLGDIPFLTGSNGIPLLPTTTMSLGFPRVQMQLFIQAMADNSLLKILAEPNLVCISGETASFLAGGEFPIPVPQDFDTITIEFREFGVRLNFTPIVEAHGRIRLRINPEVSETDFSSSVQVAGFVVPGLRRRSAQTTVEVGNGQTLAIAGLLSEQVRAVANRVPGIGDVPVLGALFRSVQYQKEQTELVILVTPEIVAPMSPEQVPPLPGSDHLDPDDFELYGLGQLEAASAAAPGTGAGGAFGASAGEDYPDRFDMAQYRNRLSIHGPWGHATSGLKAARGAGR